MKTLEMPEPDFPRRVGRYELLATIAAGGMGTVYLARANGARGFERVVALKKLHARLEADGDMVRMFLEEARVAARIRHPNVVATLDVDDTDGLILAMEYIEGDHLLGLLKAAAERGVPIPSDVVLRIVLDVLSGLDVAHDLTDDDDRPLKVVHRDISPQNILVGVDGITKVTDFGIAKIGDTVTGEAAEALKGKLAYMAPEQARRAKIDRRADIFATAVVLWEALTTQRLFLADSDAATFAAVLTRPIPDVAALTNLPREVADVVMKGLEREPDERWATAGAFRDALESASRVTPGVASSRRVAEHVRAVSGAKIDRERKRLRSAARSSARDALPAPDSVPASDDAGAARPMDASTTLYDPRPAARRGGMLVPLVAIVAIACTAAGFAIARRTSPERGTMPAAAPSAREETVADAAASTPVSLAPAALPSVASSGSGALPLPPRRPPASRPPAAGQGLPKNPYRN